MASTRTRTAARTRLIAKRRSCISSSCIRCSPRERTARLFRGLAKKALGLKTICLISNPKHMTMAMKTSKTCLTKSRAGMT
ncbi:uncharacterized protein A1O9_12121 [Exophiala aquamarina CBS 119918]|uniref:Uncharacterized protein n=1 Tax=Exophiala aquamarina CBS 119918 TaxID=1182545 RepID=A0A072NVA8_9EURO|nr:uncharacterized protein A1O9_12121 [Exophiala aquamarina CBS 119918]KEF51784.1 hypothetical protein A1O9_12121 [Exophiala aquamarina CBS 119918]